MNHHNDNYLEFGPDVLEKRLMMAGNVTVRQIGSDVVIRGDSASNNVRIARHGSDLQISGVSTRLNGATRILYLTIGADLRVNMGKGNDTLTIGTLDRQLTIPDDVSIKMGQGNDRVTLYRTDVGDDLRVNMGSGNANITAYGNGVIGDVKLQARGRANIDFDVSAVGGNMNISTGGEADNIEMNYVQIQKNLKVVTRGGNDYMRFTTSPSINKVGRSMRVALGSGNDRLNAAADIGGRHFVSEGSGDDIVSVRDSTP